MAKKSTGAPVMRRADETKVFDGLGDVVASNPAGPVISVPQNVDGGAGFVGSLSELMGGVLSAVGGARDVPSTQTATPVVAGVAGTPTLAGMDMKTILIVGAVGAAIYFATR